MSNVVAQRRTSEFPSWAELNSATFIACQIMEEDTIETNGGMVDVEESRILLHHDHHGMSIPTWWIMAN
jgi:hypothetical protein